MNYNKIAEKLDNAAINQEAIDQISLETSFNLEQSYAIQSISMARRYIRGEHRVGLKMGFTSKAKMEQMGVHDLIWGRLTSNMKITQGESIELNEFIHPRAEPEIAFLLNDKELSDLNVDTVKEKVSSVAIAIEIIDSRYKNFKFSLEDVIADNCSSAGFVIGEWKELSNKITDIPIALKIDGETIHAGNSNAIMGNPWESLVAALRLAKENGEYLGEGDIILAGAATPAEYLKENQLIEAEATGLGSVSFKTK